jgi:hypothetical protein
MGNFVNSRGEAFPRHQQPSCDAGDAQCRRNSGRTVRLENEAAGGTLTVLRLLHGEDIKRPRLELPTSLWFRDSSRPPGR